MEDIIRKKIRWATACATVLGAIPAPTALAITALQTYLLSSIARTYDIRPADGALAMAPLLSQSVGRATWTSLVRFLAGPTPVAMAAGGLIAGAATYALGHAAAEHFRELAARESSRKEPALPPLNG